MTKHIAVLVGSKSQTSVNQRLAKHLQKIAPPSLQLTLVDIGDLPLYDRDLDTQDVPAYTRVRDAIKQADGVIWVTPEHNGSYSAMIKNAIDVISRPAGQSLWIGKPLGLASANASGSNRAVDALRVVASGTYINMPVCPFAGVIGGIFAGAFDDNGELVSEQAKNTLQGFISAFEAFVGKF